MKPENILIDENDNTILGDMGAISVDSQTGTVIGTDLYMAPEIHNHNILQIAHSTIYDEKVDVWSLGITFCELLIGSKPTKGTIKTDINPELVQVCKEMI